MNNLFYAILIFLGCTMSYHVLTRDFIQSNMWKVYQECLGSNKPSIGKTLDDFVRCHNKGVNSGNKLCKSIGRCHE